MPKITRAEEVRRRLVAEIAAGILAPGTRLDEIEQSIRLGVSRTPLREALRELAALGLVQATAHRGVTVNEGISPHMTDALAALEALCGCRAAARMTGRARAELRQVAAERGNWLPIIHAGAGNPILARFAETLWQPLVGALGESRLAGDDLHPLGVALAASVAEGDASAVETAARTYVEACVGVVAAAVKVKG